MSFNGLWPSTECTEVTRWNQVFVSVYGLGHGLLRVGLGVGLDMDLGKAEW